jgi:hypothetical protein
VYRNFDWDGPLDFVRKAADLSERVMDKSARQPGDGAVNQWFAEHARPAGVPSAASKAAALSCT